MKTQHGGVNNQPMERVRFQCDHCPKSFEVKSSLLAHSAQAHSTPNQFQCDYCEQQFTKKHALAKHRLVHLGLSIPHPGWLA